jgi:general secretion pathway protein G
MRIATSRFRRRQGGFTLLEMIIVISIIVILVAIAVPLYTQHLRHAREVVLKEDLYSMRSSIDQYTQDKNKAPQSLDDLVSAGYLHALPKDPFTNATDSWQVVQEDAMIALDQTQPGITDVHSGSTQMSSEGTAYNTW